VVEFVEEMGGIRVAAPDELRYMTYTPPQLQRQVGREERREGGREGRKEDIRVKYMSDDLQAYLGLSSLLTPPHLSFPPSLPPSFLKHRT